MIFMIKVLRTVSFKKRSKKISTMQTDKILFEKRIVREKINNYSIYPIYCKKRIGHTYMNYIMFYPYLIMSENFKLVKDSY